MTSGLERAIVFGCEGAQLVGVLHPSTASPNTVGVVVVVGGPQYRAGSHRQFTLMARAFASSGFSVLRFDYRGMGDSDGGGRGFEHVDADIRAAVNALTTACSGIDKIVLWGLCDAASASLLYCRGDRRIAGLILANPWIRTAAGEASAYLRHYYLQRLLQRTFWQKLFSGQFRFGESLRDLFAKFRSARPQSTPERTDSSVPHSTAPSSTAQSTGFVADMRSGLAGFTGRVLLLLSGRDLVAQEFADRMQSDAGWRKAVARSGVATHRLPDADHTFSNSTALDTANRICLSWLNQFAQAASAPPELRS